MEFRCHLSNPRKTNLFQISYDSEIWRAEAETLLTRLVAIQSVCENWDIFEDERFLYWELLEKRIMQNDI